MAVRSLKVRLRKKYNLSGFFSLPRYRQMFLLVEFVKFVLEFGNISICHLNIKTNFGI